jgi:hypothetical protein
VKPGSIEGETPIRYERRGGYGAFYWSSDAFDCVLAGPPDRQRLMRISRAIYEVLS